MISVDFASRGEEINDMLAPRDGGRGVNRFFFLNHGSGPGEQETMTMQRRLGRIPGAESLRREKGLSLMYK